MFEFIKSFFSGHTSTTGSSFDSSIDSTVNPATGLPMTNGMGSVDVAGNPYGSDLSHSSMVSDHDSFESSAISSTDDSWWSSSNDSWSSSSSSDSWTSSDDWSSSSSDSWSSSGSSFD